MEPTASEILSALTDREVDAMIEIMLLAAFADGVPDPSETAVIKQSLLSSGELWMNHLELERRMEEAKARIDAESREERLTRLRTMLPWPEQRLLAIRLAMKIVAADGVILPSERELILEAADALGVRSEVSV